MTLCWGYLLLQFLVVVAHAPGGWMVLLAVVLQSPDFGCWQLALSQTPGMHKSWTQHIWELSAFFYLLSQSCHWVFVLLLL